MIKATLGSALRKSLCTYFATRRMVKDGSEYFGPYTSFQDSKHHLRTDKRTVSTVVVIMIW
jgi:excinuclease UvrABC nuclease subunit